MKILITILDAITETSMPFNEFVLYRANHFKDEKQILIVCDTKKELPKVQIPASITIDRVGWHIGNLRKAIKRHIKECELRNEPYAIHMHQNKSAALSFIAMAGTKFKRKVLFTTHNTFSGYQFHNKVQSFFCGLEANYVVCCSNSAFAGYPKLLKMIKSKHAYAIQNGVDTERIDTFLTTKNKTSSGKMLFVYVARMIPVKNHDFLINVIKRCEDCVHFVFIGATNPCIMKRIDSEGLNNRITCTGLIPRNQVFELLQESDVYISSSKLEGLPVSLLEGMYVGLPAILSNIPQHAEVSCNDDFVQLLPLVEMKWVKAINDLVSRRESLTQLAVDSKNYIRENFSLKRMHKQYNKIIEILRNEF